MTRLTIVLAIGVMALNGSPAFGQEEEAEHEEFRHHRIALFTGYTWVPQGDHHGNVSGVVVVPTLGLDYQYWVSHRFALGVINDFELSTYVIEQSDGSQLTREYAYVGAAVAIWEAVESLAIFAGPGVELEKNENFFVVKVGGEYEFRLPGRWDLSISAAFNYKDEYNSISAGLVVGKRF